jgi:hypothetical protein
MPLLKHDSRFINQSKEDFSFAYVRAVAAAGDCYVEKRDRDVAGIDGTVFQYNCCGRFPSRGLDFQLKCSHVPKLSGTAFTYNLPVKNYEYLIKRGPTDPAILIVVVVPEDVGSWTEHSEEQLLIHRCGYWTDLRAMGPVGNKNTVAIRMNRERQFSPESLSELMDRVTDDQF